MANEAQDAGAPLVPSLATVHEAVRLAIQRSAEAREIKDDSVNFKCAGQIKQAAMLILHHGGSNLSAFLQACVELLVRDYAGDDGLAKIAAMPSPTLAGPGA